MLKKNTKNSVKQNGAKKSRLWFWVFCAFILGGALGYTAHYLTVNWNGFFAKCPDGNKPDKNGCCAGEVYTDAGDGWMVCCPENADNCYPPIK
jgi:hypothetical protein